MPDDPTLATLRADLATGRTTARKLVDDCLAKTADKAGEGARVFIHVDAEVHRFRRGHGQAPQGNAGPSPFAGIPVSIKDCSISRTGVARRLPQALDDAPPAANDAPVRGCDLRRVGFVVIGRTNMSEFAYSGLGINPH